METSKTGLCINGRDHIKNVPGFMSVAASMATSTEIKECGCWKPRQLKCRGCDNPIEKEYPYCLFCGTDNIYPPPKR